MGRVLVFIFLGAGAAGLAGYGLIAALGSSDQYKAMCLAPDTPAFAHIEGGAFGMGSEEFYAEEGPVRRVEVGKYWISTHEVTNRQFASFVAETGYVTLAERGLSVSDWPDVPAEQRIPGSAVFVPPDGPGLGWWRFVPGADWRHPEGPESSIDGLDDHPVVHIAYEDAVAYAGWAGGELPSEAEWEFATRGGLDGAAYVWGGAFRPDGHHLANTWQGLFPFHNSAEDGFLRTAPVGCFGANGYGLYDMAGNVWEWTVSDYTPDHSDTSSAEPGNSVIKGGSFLCAPNYCRRYRPAARQPQDRGLGTNHIGFRIVLRQPTKK